jgi:hypothetical protein
MLEACGREYGVGRAIASRRRLEHTNDGKRNLDSGEEFESQAMGSGMCQAVNQAVREIRDYRYGSVNLPSHQTALSP